MDGRYVYLNCKKKIGKMRAIAIRWLQSKCDQHYLFFDFYNNRQKRQRNVSYITLANEKINALLVTWFLWILVEKITFDSPYQL